MNTLEDDIRYGAGTARRTPCMPASLTSDPHRVVDSGDSSATSAACVDARHRRGARRHRRRCDRARPAALGQARRDYRRTHRDHGQTTVHHN